MKTHHILIVFTATLVFAFSNTLAQQTMDSQLLLLDSQISAANGHYKTVTESILDKETALKTTKNQSDAKEIEDTLKVLQRDQDTTKAQIEILVGKYNALLKKKKN